MDQVEIIKKLRIHESELRALGIVHLSLFGSMARGELGNDVDLMADFDTSRRLTLFDMSGMELRLAEIVGMKVDLAPAKMLKQSVKEQAVREAVFAF